MKQQLTALAIFSLIAFAACKKTNYEVVTDLNVRLTSTSSFDAEQLNLDIEQVKVNYSDTTWVLLNTPNEVYNLLDFRNGIDTLIAKAALPSTSVIRQMKLVLGSRNSIKINGKVSAFPAASTQTELTFSVNRKLNRSTETITMSFDPAQSVSQAADGSYKFTPVATLK